MTAPQTPSKLDVEIKAVIANEQGLHARPAARLAQEAQRWCADVVLVLDDQEVDAKSILDILTLAAPKGSELVIRALGEDAADAAKALADIIRNRFGED